MILNQYKPLFFYLHSSKIALFLVKFSFILWVGCLSSLILIPSSTNAQKSPEKIRINTQSAQGAVIFKVDSIPVEQEIWFQKSGSSGFLSRVFRIIVPIAVGGEIYVGRTLSPGRYRLDQISQQEAWVLELSKNTYEFDVKPGKIVYLGKLQNRELLEALGKAASKFGKLTLRGESFDTASSDIQPVFSSRDDAGLKEAIIFSKKVMMAQDGMVELGLLYESHSSE
jgi:hypothetical protein